ncbi:transcription-repair coupling factor [Carboxydocella sporoproducens DSM 16521]|uniref:Transcription-repair-coupling factor n=2 Tax=Carboxydocella TaxID=178898 RepID=A0A1T4SG78_9FIRM|nr:MULTISPECIES: transcription-repair coupling factor [Carboxydocella]AVX19284.1 transcription-repair coupling factor [Carboxydocella thermautotrophica]SKA26801.1 transcription-repair coupling factor [Carboxydocella sporoproducens DSM 16521]
MTRGLVGPLLQAKELQDLWRDLGVKKKTALVYGVSGAVSASLLAAWYRLRQQPLLAIVRDLADAKRLCDDLSTFLPEEEILLYPAQELLPWDIEASSRELLTARLKVLGALARGRTSLIVAPVAALSRAVTPPEQFKNYLVTLNKGQEIEPTALAAQLLQMGYERVSQVEVAGQFSWRGGIVDIFPASASEPVRLEFFDVEIDSLRLFDPVSQRSLREIEQAEILPARDYFATAADWQQAARVLEKEYQNLRKKLIGLQQREAVGRLDQKLKDLLSRLKEGLIPAGLDAFAAYVMPEKATLLDYLPTGALIAVEDPNRVREKALAWDDERGETFASWLERGMALPGQEALYFSWEDIWRQLTGRPLLGLALLPREQTGWRPELLLNLNSRTAPLYQGNLEELTRDLKNYKRQGYAVALLTTHTQRSQQLLDLLKEAEIEAVYLGRLQQEFRTGNIVITRGELSAGFEFPQSKILILTERELFGQSKKGRKAREIKPAGGQKISAFTDLKIGDYVVHVNHGIGVYEGVEQLSVGGITRDYLVVSYAGADRLYIPTEQISLLQKYIGTDGQKPRISKLGGQEWQKAKAKARSAVKEMAEELIKLYAAREALKGFAFSPDTVWQQEFEQAFPYEETPDQLQAIAEIKADMERPRPMDRLLCGDVGYGKTEVALRAAFKAVMDNKQVAILVPTTILAQQHYNTCLERFQGFPVSIDLLSRFRSAREQKATLKKLASGQVDIIIGTHRLLQDDVKFRDLGLLIVDEEQRFGVAHKEKLKQLKQTVDVLTLSATPIPRTLHMALAGVRDMSLLETPPEERYPVQTFVVEFNPLMIRDAILRELARGGQVYFVHNRIEDMDRIFAFLTQLVPEARIAIGHGQMREDELEKVMLDFFNQEYDVLLCTTIIETGLDIPNVNTIIIDNADTMGLAQLYQLRGRVGRSNRMAYAYLTYRKDKVLTEIAEKRLQTLREFTELGSGFKIAMRDLEIRGAGNLLGPEQHGHIMAIGFDLYTQMLEEAIRELKGEIKEEPLETTVEIAIDAYLPADYIEDGAVKMEIYRKIMLCRTEEQLLDLSDELVDRFGDPPLPVVNLLTIARIKILGQEAGITYIGKQQEHLIIKLAPDAPLEPVKILRLPGKIRGLNIVGGAEPVIRVPWSKRDPGLNWVEKIIREIKYCGIGSENLV